MKVLAEKYTEMITPQVNGHIEHILMEDKDASNVLLLNYHNTLQSTHGLSYRYLTALTEKRRGYETKATIKIWKELEYINYGDELGRINEALKELLDDADLEEVPMFRCGSKLVRKDKNGSKIHIKKKNRGKFTASAKKAGQSVQEHARSVLNNPNATPLQKKRANFARNAAKWKH